MRASLRGHLVAVATAAAALLGVACGGPPGTAGNAPLSGAIGAGDSAEVRRLLDGGADPNSTAGDGSSSRRSMPRSSTGPRTPLVLAIREKHASIVRLLLAHGADATRADATRADAQGFTPLEHALRRATRAARRRSRGRGRWPG